MTRHTLWSHTIQRSLAGLPRSHQSVIPGADDGVSFDVRQHVFVKYVGGLGLETVSRGVSGLFYFYSLVYDVRAFCFVKSRFLMLGLSENAMICAIL